MVAFSFGMAITVMVYMTAHTSGGQLNPAITTGCMVAGVVTPVQAVANIISQCIGTVLSACSLMILVPQEIRDAADLAVNAVPEGSSVGRAFFGAPPAASAACLPETLCILPAPFLNLSEVLV